MTRTPKDPSERYPIAKIIDYLTSLGFEYFGTEVATSRDGRLTEADIVAYQDPEHLLPILAVELKRMLPMDLSFLDPPVQQAFQNAVALGSSVRYLLISDGMRHFWFDRGVSGQSIVRLGSPPGHGELLRTRPQFRNHLIALNVSELYQLIGRVADILRQSQLTFGLRMALELNKLLIAKLRDEECVSLFQRPARFVARDRRGSAVAVNLRALFDEAVEERGGASISFSEWASPPEVIYEVVRVIEGYSLDSLPRQVLGRLFWHLFPRLLRVNDSSHTTPLAIADLMVWLATPYEGKKILDPACGSGLLLLEAFRFGTEKLLAKDKKLSVFGIEKNAEVCELAATNFILNGISPNHLQNADFFSVQAKSFESDHLFDRVLLDPPTGWADPRDLADYHLSRQTSRLRRELLMLERLAEVVRADGRVVVVVPDVCLSSPSLESARNRLLQSFSLRAVLSLPPDAFADAGHTGKASILLLERLPLATQKDWTLVAEVSSLGITLDDQAPLESNLSSLRDVIESFLTQEHLPNQCQSDALRAWAIPAKNIDARNWSAGYLNPTGTNVVDSINRGQYAPHELGSLAEILSGQNFKSYVTSEVAGGRLVQAGAVRDLDLILDDCPFISSTDYEKGARSQIRPGDILVTTTGQYLGRSAVVGPAIVGSLIASGAVTIVRPHSNVDAFFLAAFICSPPGKEQIAKLQAAATAQPYLRRSDLKKLLVPLPPLQVQRKLSTQIQDLRIEARALAKRSAELESESMQVIVKELLEP